MTDYQALAQKAGEIASIPWQWIYAQWQFESANFTSWQANNANNYAGLMDSSMTPLSFSTPDAFANYYGNYLKLYGENGIYNATNVNQWLDSLSAGGYFTQADNAGNKYYNGVNNYLSQLGGDISPISGPVMQDGSFVTAGNGSILASLNKWINDRGMNIQNNGTISGTASLGIMDRVTALFKKFFIIIVGLVFTVLGIYLMSQDHTMIIKKEGD